MKGVRRRHLKKMLSVVPKCTKTCALRYGDVPLPGSIEEEDDNVNEAQSGKRGNVEG